MILGIDESGTGAWSGPAVVCGCAFATDERVKGLADSKKLSDKKRFDLTNQLLALPAVLAFSIISVEDYKAHGAQLAWERAIKKVAEDLLLELTSQRVGAKFEIVVDGLGSTRLLRELLTLGSEVRFEARAEDKYLEVAAASIVAKTERNMRMRELHQSYPQYGWDRNSGYGTAEHQDALRKHGRTPQHRDIQPLRGL